ncbi:TonB-dependent receptor [Christiangramia antarctica]|uniref:TonB-dependent receptor n=2 Tax=Flavobacteriaceae TaxID=49546 RepID=A0ABW5X0Q1_9FLAO
MAIVIMPCCMMMSSQQMTLSGRFVDNFTEVPLPQVKVSIENKSLETYSDENGEFSLVMSFMEDSQIILRIYKPGYLLKRLALSITATKDLGEILLQPDLSFEQNQLATISLSDAELLSEESEFDNISGILQSSRDVFLNAAAFDFSQTFFRPKGLGSEYAKIMINGMEMNKFYDGRPQWSNWGGLNDMQRNQVFTNGISALDEQFGGLGGTTNIIMRASKYQKGGRISFSGSNRSYTGRVMATYASGEQKNGWYYAISLGRRFAEGAYIDGTTYDANSAFLSGEKRISEDHSINFSTLYTPNIRGKSAALTREIFDLKGRTYNPYWGFQNEKIRNSRIREIREPIFQLNHYFHISDQMKLNTNLMYQFGETSNSRIDYGGTSLNIFDGQTSFFGSGENPDPSYYQKLPSYFLRFENNQNFESAYRSRNEILEKGQLDWNELYHANQTGNGDAVYVLANDVNKDNQFSANSIFEYTINETLKLNSSVRLSRLESQNFARVKDLLGADRFLDIDSFVQDKYGSISGIAAQSDLNNPNRFVKEADRYKYNYDISATEAEVFSQLQYSSNKLDIFIGGNFEKVGYQRNGNYRNGLFSENSFRKSAELNFNNFGLKAGSVLKISGRQNLEANLAYFTKAPGFRNTFINPRQNNELVNNPDSEKISALDLSYRYRSSPINVRLTGYYSLIQDITEVSYYFADGLSGLDRENTTAFVQESLSKMDKQYYGLELGAESHITPSIKLKTALALGEYVYANNPEVEISSANFDENLNYGKAYLKNYHLPGGPQTAAQFGVEYRDPDFWWFSTSINYFARGFLDINPLTRTTNFQKDFDGLPLNDFDKNMATKLLKQEQFEDYFLWNAVGGKSWRIKDKYVGTFVSLNNILNKLYKSGGYEQARNANFRNLKEDSDRELPLFSPKYWFGQGTTYFMNVYLRF